MTASTTPDPDRILARMQALHPKIIDLSLDRVHDLLARLGHPEGRLPPVVHVAGTNGKGSVLAYVRAMAEAADRRVHVYTSPHLVRFNERIRVAGTLIDETALERLLIAVERANEGRPITYFEITTCAALQAFAETPADLCLLETGLGGRLDATNVVDRPALTILTPISMDHEQYLGDTIAKIATEKAHIMKPGVPCLTAPQHPDAMAVIREHAARVGAPLFEDARAFSVDMTGGRLAYSENADRLELPAPALPGPHQAGNAALAIAAARRLGLTETAIAEGLTTVRWPGRLQRLTAGALVDRLAPGAELWLDGGHNPAAGRVIAAWAAGRNDTLPLRAILGLLTTKDAATFLTPLARHLEQARTVTIPNEPASRGCDALAEDARAAGIPDAAPAPSLEAALDDLGRAGYTGRVLIAGSLYLVGHALRLNGTGGPE